MFFNFCVIPTDLITDPNISPDSLRVACYLFSRKTKWEQSNKEIARTFSLSERGLRKCFIELIESGWMFCDKPIDDFKKNWKKGEFVLTMNDGISHLVKS